MKNFSGGNAIFNNPNNHWIHYLMESFRPGKTVFGYELLCLIVGTIILALPIGLFVLAGVSAVRPLDKDLIVFASLVGIGLGFFISAMFRLVVVSIHKLALPANWIIPACLMATMIPVGVGVFDLLEWLYPLHANLPSSTFRQSYFRAALFPQLMALPVIMIALRRVLRVSH